MKYFIAHEQEKYFEKNGILELEEVFDAEQLAIFEQEAHLVVEKRKKGRRVPLSPKEVFCFGRDLWRESSILLEGVRRRSLFSIIDQLFRATPIRMGFDQLISGDVQALFDQELSLKDWSSLSEIICGILVCLEPSKREESQFLKNKGNVLFIDPDTPIQFPSSGLYYLVVYTEGATVYRENKNDPCTYFLRDQQYSYGDRLDDARNLILYR